MIELLKIALQEQGNFFCAKPVKSKKEKLILQKSQTKGQKILPFGKNMQKLIAWRKKMRRLF